MFDPHLPKKIVNLVKKAAEPIRQAGFNEMFLCGIPGTSPLENATEVHLNPDLRVLFKPSSLNKLLDVCKNEIKPLYLKSIQRVSENQRYSKEFKLEKRRWKEARLLLRPFDERDLEEIKETVESVVAPEEGTWYESNGRSYFGEWNVDHLFYKIKGEGIQKSDMRRIRGDIERILPYWATTSGEVLMGREITMYFVFINGFIWSVDDKLKNQLQE